MPCCTNSDTDTCACFCGYPNGVCQTISAQILIFIGWMFSMASMSDCKFVIADTLSLPDPPFELPPDFPNPNSRRGFGFFFFEDNSGSCYWNENYNEDIYNFYEDVLGSDWKVGRYLGSVASFLAFIMWIWVLCSICVAQPKFVRLLMAALTILIILPFQYVTFTVLTSDWCKDRNCDMGRAAWFSIAAGLCFLFGSIPFCRMSDFPGAPKDEVHDEEQPKEVPAEEEEEKPAEEEEEPKEEEEAVEDEAPAEETENVEAKPMTDSMKSLEA